MNFPSTPLIFSLKSHVFKHLHSVFPHFLSPLVPHIISPGFRRIIEGIKYSTLVQGYPHLSPPSPHLVNTATLPPYPQFYTISNSFQLLCCPGDSGRSQTPPVFAFQELPAWWRHSFKSGHFQCTWAGLEFRLRGTKSRVEKSASDETLSIGE